MSSRVIPGGESIEVVVFGILHDSIICSSNSLTCVSELCRSHGQQNKQSDQTLYLGDIKVQSYVLDARLGFLRSWKSNYDLHIFVKPIARFLSSKARRRKVDCNPSKGTVLRVLYYEDCEVSCLFHAVSKHICVRINGIPCLLGFIHILLSHFGHTISISLGFSVTDFVMRFLDVYCLLESMNMIYTVTPL
jgi:hypothetical protein